ncbi:MAG: carbon-nitrogen hydrolase family protein, partial [Bacteroidota bacterium]
ASIRGDIPANLVHHLKVARLAAEQNTNLIIFPELSLTGYEPTLGKQLAIQQNDSIFEQLQACSNTHNLIIGIGVPLKDGAAANIALLLFHPKKARQVYIKQYLHEDERPFFVSQQNELVFINSTKIGVAICYELSVEAHTKTAMENGAVMYLASVAKTANGIKKSYKRMAEVARENNIPTLMVNSVGPNDDFISAGQSAVWNHKGQLISALNETQEALLIFNTTSHTTKKYPF